MCVCDCGFGFFFICNSKNVLLKFIKHVHGAQSANALGINRTAVDDMYVFMCNSK